MVKTRTFHAAYLLGWVLLAAPLAAAASDWPHWRGPSQNGVATGDLVDSWSKTGHNLVWRTDFIGRSTPIVLNGKVYVFGRSGEGVSKMERAAAFDANTGKMLWDHRTPVYNTAVPHKRVAWTSMAGDLETGNVYALGGGGLFRCYSGDGEIRWERNLTDEFNVRTGYGGRTVTPIVDEGLVIVAFVSSGWGGHAPPFMRYFAFDKKSGDIRWISAPGGRFTNPNVYSTPVVATINGERLLISGNADGNIYGLKIRTGESVWKFALSKRGLHSSVVVAGNTVFAAHGEENHDTPVLGRVVAIDATGEGDVTSTHEKWRIDGVEVGYTSLLVKDGRLYFVDNSANLYCVDTETGKTHWQESLGTVGKASPVWAGGKIYYPEVNGKFHIIEPGENSAKIVHTEQLSMPDGRYAELYGSPAVADGRFYFASEEGLYCVGGQANGNASPTNDDLTGYVEARAPAGANPAYLQIVPADKTIFAGEKIDYTVRALDEKGRFIRNVEAEWHVGNFNGRMDGNALHTDAGSASAVGMVKATAAGLEGSARLRVFAQLPWKEDFSGFEIGANAPYWLGAGSARAPATKFIVAEFEGNKVLNKPISARGVQRGVTYIGHPEMANYTIQADVYSEKIKRKVSDIGLINAGYTLEIMGARQRLEVRSWISELRMAGNKTFRWQGDTWYTIKLQVVPSEAETTVRGKVWQRGTPEPAEWSIEVKDPHPVRKGTPGVYAFTKSNVYFDNIEIFKNQ